MTAPVTQGGPEKFRRWSIAITSQDLPDFVTKAHRELHQETIDVMIHGTPVGNIENWEVYWEQWLHTGIPPSMQGYVGGRARSAWQSSLLVPKAGEPYGPNQQRYPGAREVREMNTSAVRAVLPYSRIFVTNNVPYIVVLNDKPNPNTGGGWSPQAPLQWMETALDRVKARFESGGA